jgi:catechol 2,3-dioxygenase-like lactoylglutathione lyase family enzyme
MFDHVGITVSDYAKSFSFYEKTLASLGIRYLFGEEGAYAGFGATRPMFWMSICDAIHLASTSTHIAFVCETRAEVDAFYAAAMAAGGRDNGAPGPRPQYDEHYYGAFVLDFDGNNIEAVCRKAE